MGVVQLRDATTGDLVFEGSPEECVLMADAVGESLIDYDGVGATFDPDALRTEIADEIAALESPPPDESPDDLMNARTAEQRAKRLDFLYARQSIVDAQAPAVAALL